MRFITPSLNGRLIAVAAVCLLASPFAVAADENVGVVTVLPAPEAAPQAAEGHRPLIITALPSGEA